MKMVRKMLEDAKAEGLSFQVHSEGEVDYIGSDIQDCLDALEACDEMDLDILDDDKDPVGWTCIIPELEADEVIANVSGWCDTWWEENR